MKFNLDNRICIIDIIQSHGCSNQAEYRERRCKLEEHDWVTIGAYGSSSLEQPRYRAEIAEALSGWDLRVADRAGHYNHRAHSD